MPSWYDPIIGIGRDVGRGLGEAVTGGYEKARDFFAGLGEKPVDRSVALPYFEEDRARLQGLLGGRSPYLGAAPQLGADPYSAGYQQLVRQLQDQAAGRGPSLAEQSVRAQGAQAAGQIASSAAGGRSAQGSRFAAQQIAGLNQGLAQQVGEARLREQLAAQGALQGALGAGSAAAFNREALNAQLAQRGAEANQRAYLEVLGAQLGLSQQQLQALIERSRVAASQPSALDRILGLLGGTGAAAGSTGGAGAGGAA